MKLPIDVTSPIFAADIDISNEEEDGIRIFSIDELVLLIQDYLREKGISGSLTRDVITGRRVKPVYELVVPESVGYSKIIGLVREALDQAKIDWLEPYAEDGTEFRFITPKVGIFK